jgi:hypothetical protein
MLIIALVEHHKSVYDDIVDSVEPSNLFIAYDTNVIPKDRNLADQDGGLDCHYAEAQWQLH